MGAEVAAEHAHRIRRQPTVEHARVDRPEVRLVPHVARVVLERRVPRIRLQRCRRPVQSAAYSASDSHHHPGCAVVGALAAVFADAAAEFRELQDQRVVQQALIPQVIVERERPRSAFHQVRIGAAVVPGGVGSNAGRKQYKGCRCADARSATVRSAAKPCSDRRRCVIGAHRRTRSRVRARKRRPRHELYGRAIDGQARRDARGRDTFVSVGALLGLAKCSTGIGNRRHCTVDNQRTRRFAHRVPRGERVHGAAEWPDTSKPPSLRRPDPPCTDSVPSKCERSNSIAGARMIASRPW